MPTRLLLARACHLHTTVHRARVCRSIQCPLFLAWWHLLLMATGPPPSETVGRPKHASHQHVSSMTNASANSSNTLGLDSVLQDADPRSRAGDLLPLPTVRSRGSCRNMFVNICMPQIQPAPRTSFNNLPNNDVCSPSAIECTAQCPATPIT